MTPAVSDQIAPSCAPIAPIFLRYRDNLVRYIHSKVQDPVSQEDLLSEVMVKLYDQCEQLDQIKNVEAWLIGIARHTVLDYFRKAGKKAALGDYQQLVTEEQELTDHVDITSCVHSLVDLLPAKYGQPLRLYELEGIPQKDLAARFGLSESGIKSRVQRGRKMLRDLFVQYCAELAAPACVGDGCGVAACR